MQFNYQTERLNLLILGEEAAQLTLDFYCQNDEIFAPYEAEHPDTYLSLDFQETILAAETKRLLKSQGIRYWIFKKEQPNQIIGTVSFTNLVKGPSSCCQLGYKLAKMEQGKGYAVEAIRLLIPEFMNTYHIYRIETDILQNNLPSLKLIHRLGFTFEGIARKSHEIQGIRRDHLRFSLIYEDIN